MRLAGGRRVVEACLASTPEERHHLLYDALFGSSRARGRRGTATGEDLVRHGIVLRLSDEEVVVWRQYVEYPDWFRVLYVGKIDY